MGATKIRKSRLDLFKAVSCISTEGRQRQRLLGPRVMHRTGMHVQDERVHLCRGAAEMSEIRGL
jgi:hypothetical protein